LTAELVPVSSDDADQLQLVEQLYTRARREKKRFISKWDSYYKLVRNQAWSELRSKSMPSPSSSELFPTLHTLIAYITDQYPDWYASPDPDVRYFQQPPPDDVAKQKSEDIQNCLSSWWVTSGNQSMMEMALWDTFTFGCGILKTGWDPTAKDGEGDAFCRWTDPYSICPAPEASSFEDAAYVVEVSTISLFELKARFPERADEVKLDQSGESSELDTRPKQGGGMKLELGQLGATDRTGEFPGVSGTSTSMRWAKAGSSPKDYTTKVRLIECWIRGSDRQEFPVIEGGEQVDSIVIETPKWEYIAAAGGVVLTPDTSNPFDHGQLPYVRLPMVAMGGEFWGVPLTEHLRPNQIALNRLLAAMQNHAEICGNPILLEPDQSGISNTKIVARPGARLTTNMAATNLIRWLDPPNMSPAVMNLIGFHRDTIDRVSGISAVARGTQLRRREPAAAVDAVQEASFVRIRAVIRNVEEALRRVGQLTASNMVQFYTDPRTLPIVGPEMGGKEAVQLSAKHFWIPQMDVDQNPIDDEPMRFQIWAQAGSAQPISRMARASEADMLFQMGAIGIEDLLSAHSYPGAKDIAAKQMQQQQIMQQQMAMRPKQG
jgi:hypothetical protein